MDDYDLIVPRTVVGQPLTSRLRTHWLQVLLGALLGLALGVAAGLVVVPVSHTAEVRLIVGVQTVNAQAVPGYSAAADQLAVNYSRLSTGDELRARLGTAFGDVSVSPVPDSSVIRVEARAASSEKARALAESASAALISTVSRVRESDTGLTKIRSDLSAAQADLDGLTLRFTAAQHLEQQAPSVANLKASIAASSAVAVGRSGQEALSNAYQQRLLETYSSASELTKFQSAVPESSSLASHLELGGLAGALLGLLTIVWLLIRRTKGYVE